MRNFVLVGLMVVVLAMLMLVGCGKTAESSSVAIASSTTTQSQYYQMATGTEVERLREITERLLPLTEAFSQTTTWASTKHGLRIETSDKNKQIFFESFTADSVSTLKDDVTVREVELDGRQGVMISWTEDELEIVLILSQEPKETVFITVA